MWHCWLGEGAVPTPNTEHSDSSASEALSDRRFAFLDLYSSRHLSHGSVSSRITVPRCVCMVSGVSPLGWLMYWYESSGRGPVPRSQRGVIAG